MTIDYKSTTAINLQDAIRDINTRVSALEAKQVSAVEPMPVEDKPDVHERVEEMLRTPRPTQANWTPAPPKKA